MGHATGIIGLGLSIGYGSYKESKGQVRYESPQMKLSRALSSLTWSSGLPVNSFFTYQDLNKDDVYFNPRYKRSVGGSFMFTDKGRARLTRATKGFLEKEARGDLSARRKLMHRFLGHAYPRGGLFEKPDKYDPPPKSLEEYMNDRYTAEEISSDPFLSTYKGPASVKDTYNLNNTSSPQFNSHFGAKFTNLYYDLLEQRIRNKENRSLLGQSRRPGGGREGTQVALRNTPVPRTRKKRLLGRSA